MCPRNYIISVGNSITQLKMKKRDWLFSIYTCIGLSIWSVCLYLKAGAIPLAYLSILFYIIPVGLLMHPKVKEQFK